MKNDPKVVLTIEIGHEICQVALTAAEWSTVLAGTSFEKEVVDYFDGQLFIYEWKFNSPNTNDSLVVDYRQREDVWSLANGFAGDIQDAALHFTDDESTGSN